MMKKQYQHIYNYCIAFVIIATAVSCQKLLNEKPQTEYSSTNFWQAPAQAAAALNGAYNRLQVALNTEFFYYGEGRADLDSLLTANDAASIGVNRNALNPNISFSDWGNLYQVINQANLVIKNVPVMRSNGLFTSTADYNSVLGQAYGLRALCYFYMTRVWGNVPLITEPTASTDDINSYKIPRTDTLQIYKTISNDLYSAKKLLPVSYSVANATRANLTQGAIDAILTDYYMTRGNIDSALITAQNVIANTQYKLAALYDPTQDFFTLTQSAIDNTDYAKMFIVGFSAESIFEIDYNYAEGTSSGISGIYGGGTGVALFAAHPRMLAKFAAYPNDLRTLADLKSTVQVYKNFPKGTYDRVTENDKNVILYRLSDIILMKAEAYVRKNNLASAWPLIKTIRERAFGPSGSLYNPIATGPTSAAEQTKFLALSQANAIDYVLDERARELCFEGKRWYDLVREGRAIPIMGPINNLKTKENILWPISLTVLRQNPQIEQNSYYK